MASLQCFHKIFHIHDTLLPSIPTIFAKTKQEQTAMASLQCFHKIFHINDTLLPSIPTIFAKTKQEQAESSILQMPISKRNALLMSTVLPINLTAISPPCLARERRSRKNIPTEEYRTSSDGLKYYDLIEGRGSVAEKGSTVQVHFDCVYRGITALSSRESKLLAGNRIIAQPYEFIVGSPPGKERKREYVDNANGLYSAQAAPKPPPAMYTVTEGMRVGGKRRVIVPPEVGYGKKGQNEIPPGATFELNVELLRVTPPAS